jgi:adenosine deaminase
VTVLTSALLAKLPKAELHCHLDGSLRPQTMLELARDQRVAMPKDDAEALRNYMRVDDARNLEDYLARFGHTLSVMQSAEAVERIAYELAEDCSKEGVRYLETRFAPVLNSERGLSMAQAVEASLRGLSRAEREFGIVARVIVCGIRNMSPQVSLQLSRLAVDFMHRGVVGFDLAGGEAGNPASRHKAAFDHAFANGLPCTCHAGEGDGASSVADAIHNCHAHRIGHGTRLIEDAALMAEAKAKGVAIECCLTSNVQTHAVASLELHPLRKYVEAGLKVSLNTDNRLMSGTDLVTEYGLAAKHLDFSFDELCKLARGGFENAFLPEAERAKLLARVDTEIDALRRSVQ